jgi:hypothetical protein
MKEADHCSFGHGPHPTEWGQSISDAEKNGEMLFKAIKQRKPLEDQNVPLDRTYMDSAVVVWNRTQISALRYVAWASQPMRLSGALLNKMFEQLPKYTIAASALEQAKSVWTGPRFPLELTTAAACVRRSAQAEQALFRVGSLSPALLLSSLI